MNKSLPQVFDAITIECVVYFNKGLIDHEVVKLVDIKKTVTRVNNVNSYIKIFIDKLKDTVIRKLPCLNLVKIELNVFDRNNILHRFIITISNMLQDLLKFKQKIDFNKTIIVCILYDNEMVFIGDINFTGLD